MKKRSHRRPDPIVSLVFVLDAERCFLIAQNGVRCFKQLLTSHPLRFGLTELAAFLMLAVVLKFPELLCGVQELAGEAEE